MRCMTFDAVPVDEGMVSVDACWCLQFISVFLQYDHLGCNAV
jgi:hypothetical protein